MNARRMVSGVVAAICLVGLGACRSSGDSDGDTDGPTSTSTGQSADPAGTTRGMTAEQVVAAHSREPEGIPTLAKLPKVPPKGVKVVFLNCGAPACAKANPGFTAATKALGWESKIIVYDAAQPGQAMQQAINARYTYIVMSNLVIASVGPQLAQAKAKGIPVFGAFTDTTSQDKAKGIYGVAGANEGASSNSAKVMADWTIVDSNRNANVLFISLSAYKSVVDAGDAARAEYKANCPKCSFDVLGLSTNQFANGQGPAAVVGYLKTHPKINYVYAAFNDLDTGVAAAIKSAGLAKRVKIVGLLANKTQMQNIVNGSERAWTILPQEYVMWSAVDWMARLNQGVLTKEAVAATSPSPTFIVDTPAAAKVMLSTYDGNWPGPKGFEASFKTLWGV